MVETLGVDIDKLERLMKSYTTEANINEYGRFDALKDTVDRTKAKVYFEDKQGNTLTPFKISIKIDNLLKEFILKDGFDI